VVELAQAGPRVAVVDDGIGGRALGQPGQPQVGPGGPGARRERVVRPKAGRRQRPDLAGSQERGSFPCGPAWPAWTGNTHVPLAVR
jgi:hypothetical protein